MKAILALCVSLELLPIGFIAWYQWDSSENHGFEFGYNGEFNRLKNALGKIPGIRVASEWIHQDLDLEEFGFDVNTDDGKRFPLNARGIGSNTESNQCSPGQCDGPFD